MLIRFNLYGFSGVPVLLNFNTIGLEVGQIKFKNNRTESAPGVTLEPSLCNLSTIELINKGREDGEDFLSTLLPSIIPSEEPGATRDSGGHVHSVEDPVGCSPGGIHWPIEFSQHHLIQVLTAAIRCVVEAPDILRLEGNHLLHHLHVFVEKDHVGVITRLE